MPDHKPPRRLLKLALFCCFLWALAGLLYIFDRPLLVPVDGVAPRNLARTFGAPRGGGRRQHRGTDIFARRRTPVFSSGWGIVLWRGELPLGGKVLFTFGQRGVLCYYAHLDEVTAHAGDLLHQGETIGFVGNTGNARTTAPHLHFQTHPAWRFFLPVEPVDLLQP